MANVVKNERTTMMIHSRPEVTHTHQTAPTRFIEPNGIRFAYRRFGKSGGVPLVFNQHFTGTMDHCGPGGDRWPRGREVILFNNAGVSSSSGEIPTSFEQMAANAVSYPALFAADVTLFLDAEAPFPTKKDTAHD